MGEKMFFFYKMGKGMFLFLQNGKGYVLISAKWERMCSQLCKMEENINILFLNSSGKCLHNQLIGQMFQNQHFLNGGTLFSLIHDFPSMRDLNNSLV
jgi:hypothetical protein